ncbi:MAG: hypothetical protein GX051_03990 [Clostridiales bacterium]|nr:hypothetical protein [Clostridiales bacterium]
MSFKYDIAAIIWPSYTGDELRSRIFWPEGYGEWQTVKAMTNKGYEGCRWPRIPSWGYVNEANADVMKMQIDVALKHNVNVFIYDWYWYDNRPFLENCLNDGFLKADNNKDMKFYLMWANHNADYLWDKRNAGKTNAVVWNGSVTPEIFESICERTIEKYFKQDNYYCIDGCPVYMIFDLRNFVESFKSVDTAKAAMDGFRAKARAAGFNGVHFQLSFFTDTKISLFDGAYTGTHKQLMEYLGFDSFTNYNWACCLDIDKDYSAVTDDAERLFGKYSEWNIPYYPNITVGWDNNVRFDSFQKGVIRDNTPEKFEQACRMAKAYADKYPERPPLITVNSWNEWTETSYLEPDDLYGLGYLEAIRRVFG